MLRFRPIAPKPSTGSPSSSVDPTVKKMTRGRPKRKYGRPKKNDTKVNQDEHEHEHDPQVTTLELFPNATTGLGRGEGRLPDPTVEELPVLTDFNRFMDNRSTVGFFPADQADPTVTKSVVTVESITDICTIGGIELGRTDEEKVKNLERDTSPSFVSDGYNRVMWINHGYSQMMRTKDVSLVTVILKAKLPVEYPAFACVVRVQMGPASSSSSRVLPCDVWRMDFGGLAWRLDLRAALSLGR